MSTEQSRRQFFTTAGSSIGAVALLGLPPSHPSRAALSMLAQTTAEVSDRFPRQDDDAVAEMVTVAHFNFERAKELVSARPALAKACWDWGYGDWESALGAASHTGRRDIAELLLEHGARPNLFTFVMFGKVEAVQQILRAVPGLQRVPGPHGITLLQHAKNRLARPELSAPERADLETIATFLESLGDADLKPKTIELSESDAAAYTGEYVFGDNENDRLIVEFNRQGNLAIKRKGQSGRVLHAIEPYTFSPAGAPAVRIHFDMQNGRASILTVHDPMPLVKAVRAGG